ncbi:hypothetical protein [Roseiconus lacunae]|uniref:Uncharacterized protein n=1 Tax=Roseiconus lacunae TaxID=2605694 RepID=A0ABT7PMW7_9BACT|nr:hypothetical protein [Roseiconus lacunae]MDM4017678.1 hypothetical protein [Roseiconus lacunae]WRQ51061.1 hypothetical protein U8335_00645 [Stieleria sp. HD01]
MNQEDFNGNASPVDQDAVTNPSEDPTQVADEASAKATATTEAEPLSEVEPSPEASSVADGVSAIEASTDEASVTGDSDESAAEPIKDEDLDAAKAAWDKAENNGEEAQSQAIAAEDLERASELAEPYVGLWNKLISTTNWEKGKIISEWRAKLIASGVDATQYSDEAWSRRVGGVTSPHVGRLRRVYERFGDSFQSYENLYWSHFLAALDWEDAPMWLEGAAKEKWSISAMRESRWKAEGAVESNRPTASQIIEVDTDEDVTDITEPAQGGGSNREYDNEGSGTAAGPTFEGPDFGEEEELQTMGGQAPPAPSGETVDPDAGEENAQPADPVQPFMGLPDLPDDLTDAVESMKLSILRHKSAGWRDVDPETVQRYLEAIGIMLRAS